VTVKPTLVYFMALVDEPNTAAEKRFLSVFNPSTSVRVSVALGFIAQSYAVQGTTVAESLTVYRTTAASGGTLIAAADVPRFNPLHPDPKVEVRINNPTVTVTGRKLLGIAPVVSTGAGAAGQVVAPTPGASFIMYPGQGLVFMTEAGDVDQLWNLQYVWAEAGNE
jgi:hypothetical protein